MQNGMITKASAASLAVEEFFLEKLEERKEQQALDAQAEIDDGNFYTWWDEGGGDSFADWGYKVEWVDMETNSTHVSWYA